MMIINKNLSKEYDNQSEWVLSIFVKSYRKYNNGSK